LFKHNYWGRTGFDSSLEAQTACRGWFVGLVKNRTKKINADNEGLALAA
jgi:beta-lactamase class D